MKSPPSPRPSKAGADVEAALLASARAARRGPRVSSRVAILLALCGMVWATVAQSEVSQALQARAHFDKPFFIVCFNHTLTGVLVPITLAYFKLLGTKRDRYEASWFDVMPVLYRHSVLPPAKLMPIAGFLSFFFLFVDYFWYAALTGVSVTAATAIGNCTPLFVYCFSILFLGERISAHKVGGVLLAFVGVTLILLFQNTGISSLKDASLIAGLLVVLSSAFTAGYDVAFKALLGAEVTDTATVLILTGLSGVLTIPMWAVGSIMVAYSPFTSLQEPFGVPASMEGTGLLVLSGSMAVLINVCTPLLLSWTSPLETSVGMMLVVPLSGVWDVCFHGTRFSVGCLIGTVLVLVGFGVLEYVPTKPAKCPVQHKSKYLSLAQLTGPQSPLSHASVRAA